jgi:hypothetical protein
LPVIHLIGNPVVDAFAATAEDSVTVFVEVIEVAHLLLEYCKMDAAIKSFTILRSIGQSPFGDEPNTVKGEATDSVVTSTGLGFMGLVALAALGSAGTWIFGKK